MHYSSLFLKEGIDLNILLVLDKVEMSDVLKDILITRWGERHVFLKQIKKVKAGFNEEDTSTMENILVERE